jgi:G3E family GTPase
MIADGTYVAPWKPDEPRVSRMVFIGRDLSRPQLRRGFESCAA